MATRAAPANTEPVSWMQPTSLEAEITRRENTRHIDDQVSQVGQSDCSLAGTSGWGALRCSITQLAGFSAAPSFRHRAACAQQWQHAGNSNATRSRALSCTMPVHTFGFAASIQRSSSWRARQTTYSVLVRTLALGFLSGLFAIFLAEEGDGTQSSPGFLWRSMISISIS